MMLALPKKVGISPFNNFGTGGLLYLQNAKDRERIPAPGLFMTQIHQQLRLHLHVTFPQNRWSIAAASARVVIPLGSS
ncbi:MAG: hypothetical protein K2P18_02300, partial [Oscillospiraceae bacterium]|nr:hypothetical protein [Oscillospiraceae bacterium]